MTAMGQDLTNRATRARRSEEIIGEILAKYGIDKGTLRGPTKTDRMVEARIEAAHRLRSLGLTMSRIGEILNRDHTVISYYFQPIKRANRRDSGRLMHLLAVLPADVKSMVKEIAATEDKTAFRLMGEWITERARHEAKRRVRIAA